MPRTRKSHPPSLKAKVAVEAIKAHKTITQIAQMFGVHPTLGRRLEEAGAGRVAGRFRQRPRADPPAGRRREGRAVQADRPTESGVGLSQKKSWPYRLEERRRWIDPQHPSLRVQRQCDLLGVPRSTYYYQPRPESAENLRLLRRLDEFYMECPFFGSRRMAVMLEVSRKRIQRLMRILGIEALYPKPNLSRPAPGHEIYPYLLRGVSIERPNQVWSTDITYLPMHGGFLYLVAVMDWFSRFVLSWELSNTMETGFCLAALEAAFRFGQPEIWNSDQGVAVHLGGLSGAAEKARRLNQHGWTGPRPGQRFHRAPVAQSEVRADLPRRLRRRRRPVASAESLLPFLQPPAPAPGARLSHAGRSVPAPVKKEKVTAIMGGSAPHAPRDLSLFFSRVDGFASRSSATAVQWRGLIGG